MTPVAWAVQMPDGRIDHELVGTQREVEWWCSSDEGRAAGRRPAALFLSAPEQSRWYVLGVHWDATVCVDRAEAELIAADHDRLFPRSGPHRVVRMAVVEDESS